MSEEIRPKRNSTVNEFMERNCISRATFYAEINAGHLPTIKVRNKRLITPEGEAIWLERKSAS